MPLTLEGLPDAAPWWDWLCDAAAPSAGHAPGCAAAPWALFSRCLAKLKPPASATTRTACSLWTRSAQHLLQVVFDTAGHDPRQRIQAGLALGRQGELGSPQGDHLRYERVAQGVRLRRKCHRGHPQWLACGGPGQVYRLAQSNDGTGPLGLPRSFAAFEVAAYPVTVGEFAAFLAYPQALLPTAPWWQAAGEKAVLWVTQAGLQWRPSSWHDERCNNPLQPATGITAWAADAYAHWAQQVLYAGAAGFDERLCIGLPTEWQLEAALRGPWRPAEGGQTPFWPGHTGSGEPDPMLFNHVETGWGWPTPVGCFGGSTTADGLADGAGNVWNWCANSYDESGRGLRALRGGSYFNPARLCAAGARYGSSPDYDNFVFGFRLVRVVCE